MIGLARLSVVFPAENQMEGRTALDGVTTIKINGLIGIELFLDESPH